MAQFTFSPTRKDKDHVKVHNSRLIKVEDQTDKPSAKPADKPVNTDKPEAK